MIEIVAIDNRNAERELLNLAANFAESRLFEAKQNKGYKFVVEVTGAQPPSPISRAQLSRKAGLFKSSAYEFDCLISLSYGFETAVLQLMHEMVHISQIVNGRYQIAPKTVKQDGAKQLVYTARWLGKKAGLVDDIMWQERPWEQEAVRGSEQLSAEFMAMLYGTQTMFAAQNDAKGQKGELRFYAISLSVPTAHDSGQMPEMQMPEMQMPEMQMPEMQMPEMQMPELAVPSDGAAGLPDATFGMPEAALDSRMEIGLPSDEAGRGEVGRDEAIFADIDALLAADDTDNKDVEAFGFGAPRFDGSPQEAAPAVQEEARFAQNDQKSTYVQGIAEPRILKLSVLEAKKRELEARGLLEK